jgi:putative CRISPR-associated protein (TIGR02619 family)
MRPKPHTLLCTVGTSLFEGNLRRLDRLEAPPPNASQLQSAFTRRDWRQLGEELAKLDPNSRCCGAEINTLCQLRSHSDLALRKVVFFVSDTEDGRDTGEVLSQYLSARRDLDLEGPAPIVVEQLQDARPRDFRNHGLRNLVRRMGEQILQGGGPEFVAIDATGGYKAQIAVAVVLGQALGIPVFYKHEKFSETIAFPPLPISLDYSLFGTHADLLNLFERGGTLTHEELKDADERLFLFLNEEKVDSASLYELNAVGQIYLTGFRITRGRTIKLTPAKDRKIPTFRSDHYPKGFKEFVNRIWEENSWIKTARSTDYSGQAGIKAVGFRVRHWDSRPVLEGTYLDKDGFGARFELVLEDSSLDVLTLAADRLNEQYAS